MLQRRRRRCLPRRLRWHGLCCMGRDRLLRAPAHGIGVSGRCQLVLDEQCQHKQPGCECHGKHCSAPSQEIDAARCTARTPEARMAALRSISLILVGAEPHVTISPWHGPMLVGAAAGWLPLYLLVRRVPVGDRAAPRRHVSSSGGGVQASTLAGRQTQASVGACPGFIAVGGRLGVGEATTDGSFSSEFSDQHIDQHVDGVSAPPLQKHGIQLAAGVQGTRSLARSHIFSPPEKMSSEDSRPFPTPPVA